MKKLMIIPILFFVGCNSPLDKIDKNTKQIQELNKKIEKIDEIDIKVQTLEITINNLKEELKTQKEAKQNVNEIIQKLASLKQELNKIKNKPTFDYIVINPMTLITTKKANIYNKPSKSAKIVNSYPKETTFTTYKEKNGFVKVTGYFVHNKWVENKKEWWIEKNNTAVKRLAK